MIMRPVYGPFRLAIEMNERVMTDVCLICDERNNYSIDFEKFESECKKMKTRWLFFAILTTQAEFCGARMIWKSNQDCKRK